MVLPGEAIVKIKEAIKSACTGRDKLVMMLRTRLDIEEADVPNHSDYNQVVFDLITKLEQKGCIPDLIQGALREVPGNPVLQNLPKILIELINEKLRNQEQEDDVLEKICRKINVLCLFKILIDLANINNKYFNQIKHIYLNYSSEKFYEDWEEPIPETIIKIWNNIQEIHQDSEREPPLIQFAACLLKSLLEQEINSNPKLGPLSNWVQNNANNYQELFNRIESDETSREESQIIQTHLIILIEPSIQEADNNIYIVKSWVKYDSNWKPLDINYQKKEKFSFEEIPNLLNYFIQQSIDNVNNLPTTIEFFLPRELFNQPIDTFIPKKFEAEEEDDDDDEEIYGVGMKYNVSIRSYQRIKRLLKKKCRDEKIIRWQNKWKTLHEKSEEICYSYLISGDNLETRTNEILRQIVLHQILGVALSEQPTNLDKNEILKNIDSQGIPVALWLRTESINSDFVHEFEAIFKDCPIAQLPNRIKNKRLDAFRQKNHIGKHIALLWDNPNILPPEILPASLP